ncbi:MAG: iron-containing alcohol dehydrogenase, partial [Gordonibacter sp.]
MRALIFNSGLGSRLGELTASNPKAMVRLGNGETIFGRQLRILHACGIDDFVVTTGPYADQLRAEAARFEARGCTFSFVPNEVYDQTNYIYSMYLARDLLRDGDFLVLHGDLVFDMGYVRKVLGSEVPSLGSVDVSAPLPEKDFKARVVRGKVHEVSVGIFDADCVAFQPFYKLSQASMTVWLDAVCGFVDSGDVKIYAENAANVVFDLMDVDAFGYEGHFVEEVDTLEDLERVSAGIGMYDFEQQPVFELVDGGASLVGVCYAGGLDGVCDAGSALRAVLVGKPLVVTGSHLASFGVKDTLDDAFPGYEVFSGFSSNPTYDEVLAGLEVFANAGCESIVSVGGGSAIDVAKCIKAFLGMRGDGAAGEFATQTITYSPIPHVAVPTTAGTGSESTRFAVCYVDGVKTSIAQDCLLPDAAVLDASSLEMLPGYQKKCTLLDALCQAVESYWSVSACEKSREYSAKAIGLMVANWRAYLDGDVTAARLMMKVANLAGKAINLTTTTAAHAMSYKLTSLYGIPHGHAVALCMPAVWGELLARCEGDPSEANAVFADVRKTLSEISALILPECTATNLDPSVGLLEFEQIVAEMGLPVIKASNWRADVPVLVESVNVQRLGNFPLLLGPDDLAR